MMDKRMKKKIECAEAKTSSMMTQESTEDNKTEKKYFFDRWMQVSWNARCM